MQRHHIRTAAALAALALALPPAAPAQQGTGGTVAAGMLSCDMTGDTNLVILSSERFDCTYRGAGGATDHYRGEISKLGADLQIKRGQTLKWAVLAPSTMRGPGILSGRYVGGSTEATVIGGLGARALVGGSGSQITLQPVSLSGQTGFGASVTVDRLRLIHDPG